MSPFSNTWVRPAAFVMANLAVALLLGLALVRPGIDFLQDQEQRIEQGALTLERVRATIARNETVATINPAQIEAASHRFIQGESEGLQNADLLRRLRQLADEQGLSLSSATTLPPRAWSNRRLVGARIDFTAPTERVASILATIEYGPALLFIEQATMSPAREGSADMMTISLEVYGVAQWQNG